MMVIVAGLLALFLVLNGQPGRSVWAGPFGAAAAVLALGLYGVLQAVDGVALKHAVDAWATAPGTERAARFASAEAIRWLEWSIRSYHSYLLGMSFLLYGTVVTAALSRPIGYVMGLSGLAYIAQGWVIGSEGFSASNAAPNIGGDCPSADVECLATGEGLAKRSGELIDAAAVSTRDPLNHAPLQPVDLRQLGAITHSSRRV